jgi:hypothetical protein
LEVVSLRCDPLCEFHFILSERSILCNEAPVALDLGVGFVGDSVLPMVVRMAQPDQHVCEEEFRPDLVSEFLFAGAEVFGVILYKIG